MNAATRVRRLVPGLVAFLALPAFAASTPPLDQQFTQTVQPVIAKYCVGCHSGNSAAAQFDLKSYDSLAPCCATIPAGNW